MNLPAGEAAHALDLARRGDLGGAIVAGEAALATAPGDVGLRLFVGTLCCRQGDVVRGIGHFREALAASPGNAMIRVELARALLVAGDLDGVEQVAGAGDDLSPGPAREFARLRAHVDLRRGAGEEAARRYAALTIADPQDFESWQGLGLARLASGDAEGAVEALHRAVRLQPRLAAAQLGLGRALLVLDRVAEARGALFAATEIDPDAAEAHFELSRAEVLLMAFDRAEVALRRALALAPDNIAALGGYGDMLERANRLDELRALLDDAATRGLNAPSLTLLRARLLRREGRLGEALAAARADEDDADPLRAQTIGEIADQLGDAPAAFAAFERMNALVAAASPAEVADAINFREALRGLRRLTTEDWYRAWPPGPPADGRPAPVFLFGFPRSGTTLLDTMLMGHPDTVVLEEEPVLQRIADRIGPPDRIPRLGPAEITELRALYWREVDAIAPDAPGRMVIDKFPLGLVGTAYLHRLFPDARYIFAERHPCDAVLSCFITRFRLNPGMANFLRLQDAATVYDMALGYWDQCEAVFGLPVHRVRYERMIVDVEAELRPLAAFLGLPWDAALIDHRGSAATRAHIATPSYSQVTEPIYTRAKGRWQRYADQMAPVLPLLAPWCERMGYDL